MHPAREHTRQVLSDRVTSLTSDEVHDAEVGVFNSAIAYATAQAIPCIWNNSRFRVVYEHKSRSLIANLDANSYINNQRLLKRLQDGECVPHEISSMPRDRLFPEKWADIVRTKMQREEYLQTAQPAAMTDQFLCSRCKKRECSFTEMQMRSCDEPASLFIQCLTCGHRWRIG